MTRQHPNRTAWDAIGRLAGRHKAAAEADFHARPDADRGGHPYRDWQALERWAAADRDAHQSGYNGWANYETWSVVLWLEDDEASSRYWRQAAREAARDAVTDPAVVGGWRAVGQAARHRLAERLHQSLAHELIAGVYDLTAELLGASLHEVDWGEVAENFLDAAAE